MRKDLFGGTATIVVVLVFMSFWGFLLGVKELIVIIHKLYFPIIFISLITETSYEIERKFREWEKKKIQDTKLII